MTELTESIRAYPDDEWKSSTAIAAELGTRSSNVYRVLNSQYRFGLVEKKTEGRTVYWRVVQ